MKILKDFSLKKLNSFSVEAKASYFLKTNSIEEIQELIRTDFLTKNKFFILGGGYNVLFTKNFDGIILKFIDNTIKIKQTDKETIFLVSAGVIWDDFVKKTVENQVVGFGNLAKIPGNVGSAAVQNIGAYGVEQCDFFKYLEAIDLTNGKKEIFDKKACKFEYRNSFFKNINNKFLITKVCYAFPKENKFCLNYPDLKKKLENKTITTKLVYQTVSEIRSEKLPDPEHTPNVGSFFKNPVIDVNLFNDLRKKYPEIKYFNTDSNDKIKIPAAWLIEKCNWKGKRIGNVGVYEKHSLIIISNGRATGKEIYDFAQKIISSVFEKFGINLEPEVVII